MDIKPARFIVGFLVGLLLEFLIEFLVEFLLKLRLVVVIMKNSSLSIASM